MTNIQILALRNRQKLSSLGPIFAGTPSAAQAPSRPKVNQMQSLAEQRGRLLERIALQRSALQEQWVPVHLALAKGDRAMAVAVRARLYVQAHRATFTAAFVVACAALVVVKPGRSLRLLKGGFVLWRRWRMVQSAGLLVPGSLLGTVLRLIQRRFLPEVFR